ncbi:MAG: D-tyrosyl-tRNA(Tyr) deacylase [Bacteroidales bacterium]|nr:D-tyrosyl-tRNA(Tyr) deacylase [Bacteroidales bacterium]
MRVVIQRVRNASVNIDGNIKSSISKGLFILVGIEMVDTIEDAKWLASKIVNLRIFEDSNGVMNLNVNDVDGEILVVSQFTLHAKTKKGNRPSYINAASPEIAIPVYEQFIELLKNLLQKQVKTGKFGAMMDITLENYGPVTIIIDSRNRE